MANLLFSSGFEGGTNLSAPNGGWQDITGTDSETGFDWAEAPFGGDFQIQLLTDGGAISNSIDTVTGHDGGQTRALTLDVDQTGNGSTQSPLLLNPGEAVDEFYASFWMKLPANFASYLGDGGWAQITPNWKTAGDFRNGQAIEVEGGRAVWTGGWDNNANGGLPNQKFWVGYDRETPVPEGEWFKVESYTKRDNVNGETWFKVNGETVLHHTGDNIGVNGADINRIFLGTSYGSAPFEVQIDDLQIWDSVPTGGASPAPAPASEPASEASTPAPITTTIGSGPDELLLQISQDSWQGDAQYAIHVNGEQVGDVLTAQALHGSGDSDTVAVLGDWGAGDHTVAVEFLNDAWGGAPETDRNLYVDGATYNGAEIADAMATLYRNGGADFAF